MFVTNPQILNIKVIAMKTISKTDTRSTNRVECQTIKENNPTIMTDQIAALLAPKST